MALLTPVMHLARRGSRTALAIAVLALIVTLFLAPYVWIAASSFKPQFFIFRDLAPLGWRTFIPENPTLDNFAHLFVDRGIAQALINSAIVSGCQVAGTMTLCAAAAYGLTRIEFRGRNTVFVLVLLTALLPIESLMVPLYRVVTRVGFQDSLIGAFIPWIASPFGLFLLRQAFEDLPRELDDAARIDGAGHFRIFWSIVLPNVRTSLATLALITFLFSWNAYLWPLVILQSPQNMVVQVAIAQSVAPGQLPNWGETFAGATIATLPLILLFIALQKFFVRGMATSGLKG
jgi:ABC-type glycerol-3-phosphate transport system permease component